MKCKLKVTGRVCPLCGGARRYPMALSRKLRPLVFIRGYSCLNCHSQYVVLFAVFSMIVERGFKPFYVPSSETDRDTHSE